MPHFNLRYFLQTLGERLGRDACIVQIGAMDGKTFDPVHEYITRFGWSGLLVEPTAEQFARLQETYRHHPKLKLVRTAVTESKGEATLHRLDTSKMQGQKVPKWACGASSLYIDRNALGFEEMKDYLITETVPATTLPALLDDYGIDHIDIVQIDAEGHDYHILKQLDFVRFQPTVINFEIVNLPKAEQNAAKRLLDAQGYLHTKAGYDLLCVQPQRFFR